MKRYMQILVVFLCVCAVNGAIISEASAQGVVKKKLIELGWDIPTTSYLREHWQEMESNAPFDGVVYDLTGRSAAGEKRSSQRLFSAERWEREEFRDCITDLRACEFVRYRHNFIRVNFYPAGFAWTDDEAWGNVCNNVGICAWVAKETGGELCFDFESYGAQMFRYDSTSGLSFDETRAIVRKRGAEFAGAAFEEKHDLVILCLWMNSINYQSARMTNPTLALRVAPYGLLPAFIDGMLDAAPLTAKLVEGCENGYYMNGREEYYRSSLDAKLDSGPAMRLVSLENRAKYRLLVSSGFGFYLDMYSNPEGSAFYRGAEPGETRFDRLRANLQAAFDSSDEYVWIYGEQKRWWGPDNGSAWTSWEEALPGIANLIFELSDPLSAAQALKEKYSNLADVVNEIVNGDFSQVDESANTAESWLTWRDERSHGVFQVQKGALTIKGDVNACYIQSFPVKPGERYLVSGRISVDGDGGGALVVRWQDSDGHWVSESQDVRIYPEETSSCDADGFRKALDVVKTPSNAGKLVVLLSANSCQPDERVVFKDIEAFHVD